jgi:TfoX/Sxy family transcriptional regulator of competence genes
MRTQKSRKWKPAPAKWVEAFAASLRFIPGITQRKMFGYPAAFVNGYLFTGLFEDRLILKLPAESRAELLKLPGAARFEPVPGRTMGEFVVVPPSFARNRARLKPWLELAYAYVKSFPPKTRKKRVASGR